MRKRKLWHLKHNNNNSVYTHDDNKPKLALPFRYLKEEYNKGNVILPFNDLGDLNNNYTTYLSKKSNITILSDVYTLAEINESFSIDPYLVSFALNSNGFNLSIQSLIQFR